MAATQLARENALKYFELVFPNGMTAESSVGAQDSRRWAHYFYEHGQGTDLPKVRGTLWAARTARGGTHGRDRDAAQRDHDANPSTSCRRSLSFRPIGHQ